MEKGEYWIPVLIMSCILSPIALVDYSDVFFVLSNSLIAFPWFCYSLRFGIISVYGYDFFTLNGIVLLAMGTIWLILGLVLIPILRRGFRGFQWSIMTISVLSIFLFQSVIVQYGFSSTSYDYFYITIIPLPIPSLMALIIIVAKYMGIGKLKIIQNENQKREVIRVP